MPATASSDVDLVIDSSATVELLINSPLAPAVEGAAGDAGLFAPELLLLECANALKGLERGGRLAPDDALAALEDLAALPVERLDTGGLLSDVWSLRHNLTAYDAAYVALAAALDVPLMTLDGRVASAASPAVRVVVPSAR